MSINNIHDKFFKQTFSHVSAARTLIKYFLPSDLVQQLDLDSLILQNNSFVNEKLEDYYSDIIYHCQYGDAAETITISLLLEHKSYPVNPYLQLLRYLLEGYEQQVKEHEEVDEKADFQHQIILPIVLYHGQQKWEQQPFTTFFKLPKNGTLREFIPDFQYLLIDLNRYSKEEIMAIEAGFALTGLLLMKYRNDVDFFLRHYEELLIFVEQGAEGERTIKYLRSVIIYVFQVYSSNKEKVLKVMQSIPQPSKEKAMSIYDQLIEEGKIKGIAIGKEKGKEEGKIEGELQSKLEFTFDFIRMFPDWTDKQIAELAKVKTSIIKALRKAIPTKKEAAIIKAARPLFKEMEGYKAKQFQAIDTIIKAVWKAQGEHKSDK